MESQTALDHIDGAVRAVRAVLADVDLAAEVPACPGWTLWDLAVHLGEIHRWVVGAIVEGHPGVQPLPPEPGRDRLLAWYDEGARGLLDLLAVTPDDASCWTFGPKPSTAAFWFRRQAHEHAVHAYDAVAAGGGRLSVDPALAVDGIDEVMRLMFPRQVRLARIAPLDRTVGIRPDEAADPGWVFAGDGTGGFPERVDATIGGPAAALYLLLWGRTGLDDPRLTVTGDRTAVEQVLGSAVVP